FHTVWALPFLALLLLKISLPLCALLHCPAQLTVVGPGHSVTATVGQDVVLPCHLSPQRDARTLEVRWIRAKFSETVEQMGAYSGRTELVRDGLSAGSLDLRITGLRPSDDGQYVCTVRDAHVYDEAIVELEVAEKQAAELGLSSAPDGLAPSVPAVKVTLDPHTAHPELVVSQDKSSVRCEIERKQVPDKSERFENRWCVLGLEEFREGRHCWLVEVEGEWLKYSGWAVGVARASMERKKWMNMSPEGGIWALQYDEGKLKSLTSPPTPLSLSPIPTRIWVCLDCTQGQVSFINADNGVQIFTFTAASFNGESIRPWFWLDKSGIQLYLRDSTHQTLSPALGGSSPFPDTPASPLLGPAGPALPSPSS
uniref:Butyrophilin subfamily 1 member A1 n=1 Tax=Anas platyrhynchos TaxID=8839 RepID=A0A8B9SK03_ANAPL